ncbi:MAG: hypothetical protein ACREDL_06400 [Bradyrhizobium sp.]
MLSIVKRAFDHVRGMGTASVAIPLFDGALKPNNDLESAAVLIEGSGYNDITPDGSGGIYAAHAKELLKIDDAGNCRTVEEFDSPIQAVCQAGRALAIAFEQRVIVRGGEYDGREINSCGGSSLKSLNAVSFDGLGHLYISQGSTLNPNEDWKRDLMSRGNTGRVIKHALKGGDTTIVGAGLQYCFGVCSTSERVLVSESWAHRIVDVSGNRAVPALWGLPGYPARISAAGSDGYWLSLFARRTQLIEFVLRERGYREEMMRSIPSDYWIAPSLRSGGDYLEPLQFGAVRQMGIFKPWAPTNSYGVVVRLDRDLVPKYSFHSRAGGTNHGTVSAVESGDHVFVLSKGAGRLLKLPIPEMI